MTDKDSPTELRAKMAAEAGTISWSELVKHFARGVVIRVEPNIDLIEAALVFATDDTAVLERWLAAETVARASDDDARDWTLREPEFTCVVAAPWVLVQEQPTTPLLH